MKFFGGGEQHLTELGFKANVPYNQTTCKYRSVKTILNLCIIRKQVNSKVWAMGYSLATPILGHKH